MESVPNRAPNYKDVQNMIRTVVASQKSDGGYRKRLSPEQLMSMIPLRKVA